MSDEWRVMIAETLTGNLVADVMPSTHPGFTRQLNDPGSWTIAARVDARENSSIDFHTYTTSGRYSWVVAYGQYIAQAGPVWAYTFDDHTRTLTVNGSGIFGMFSRRVTRNPNGAANIANPSQDLTYSNLSLRAIMASLIRDNLAQTYCNLPITLSNLAESGTSTRTYYGYDLKTVHDNVLELSKVDQGPEFDFAPQFTANGAGIQWVMNIGNPQLGDPASNGVWDYGGSLATINVDVNGSVSPVTRVFAKGAGTGRGLLTGFYEDDTSVKNGSPMVDYVDSSHTSASVQSTLDGWAKADQQNLSTPFETWHCSIRIDGTLSNAFGNGLKVAPGLGDFALGDAPMFYVSGHPWTTTGAYRRRIMGFQSDTPWTVALHLFQTQSFS